MLVSNDKIAAGVNIQWAVLTLWLFFTMISFAYFTLERVVEFDAHEKLKGIDSSEFIAKVFVQTPHSLESYANTIVHFSSQGCRCNIASNRHMLRLNSSAADVGMEIQSVEINQHQVIPSTPSVAILNEEGELVYFGPYGEGIDCSNTVGYAQTIMNNYIKGYDANMIVQSAKGCYCEV